MSSIDRLLERMQRSKAGWRFTDLEKVYLGLGFEAYEGAKHRLYIHPKFPQLRATVTRSSSLPIGYISHALRLAEKLKRLEGQHEEKQEQEC